MSVLDATISTYAVWVVFIYIALGIFALCVLLALMQRAWK